MKKKLILFRESLKLVWNSAPGWAAVNTAISVLRSFLPLAFIYLIKILIDNITSYVSGGTGSPFSNILWIIIAVVVVYFLDEASAS